MLYRLEHFEGIHLHLFVNLLWYECLDVQVFLETIHRGFEDLERLIRSIVPHEGVLITLNVLVLLCYGD